MVDWANVDLNQAASLLAPSSEVDDAVPLEQYRLALNATPADVGHDLDSLRLIAVNDAAVARYGYSRAKFLSMTQRRERAARAAGSRPAPRRLHHDRRGRAEAARRPWLHDGLGGRHDCRVDSAAEVLRLDTFWSVPTADPPGRPTSSTACARRRSPKATAGQGWPGRPASRCARTTPIPSTSGPPARPSGALLCTRPWRFRSSAATECSEYSSPSPKPPARRARSARAGRVHHAGRGERPDPADRALGAAGGVPPGGTVAPGAPGHAATVGCGERLGDAGVPRVA